MLVALACRGKSPGVDEGPTKATAPGPTSASFDGMPIAPREGLLATVRGVELDRRTYDELYALKQALHLPRKAAVRHRQKLVKRLVYEEMLRQEAAEVGVVVDPAQLEAEIATQKDGVADWSQHLRRRGETEASMRMRLRGELLEVAILDKQGKLAVSEAEVQAELEAIEGLPRATEALARQRAHEKRLAQGRNALRPALQGKYAPVLHVSPETVGE
jgi:hypothetical protein